MRALRFVWLAAFIGALIPSFALGRDGCDCSCERPAEPGADDGTWPAHDEPSDGRRPDADRVIASVELGVGLSDTIQTFDASGEVPVVAEQEAESTLIITPVVEWPLGRSVFIGGGLRIMLIRLPPTGWSGCQQLS